MDQSADILAIMDVVNRYGVAIDTKDHALLATCFTPDAVVKYGSRTVAGADVAAFVQGATVGRQAMQHLLGSHQVKVNGDTATCLCHLNSTHVFDGGKKIQTTIGTYRDTLSRTPAGWKIVARSLDVAWSEERTKD